MFKVSKIVAALAILPVLAFAAPVYADSPGQLAGGNVYVVKNVTQGGAYGSSAAAKACGDVFQFSTELQNTQFGQLTNIVVKTTLPNGNGSSTMTATTDSGGTTGTSGSVSLSGMTTGQSLSYVSGSTKLYNGSGALVKSLSDGITTASGINVGDLAGSTKEFVNFQAKVSCASTPNQIKVCELATKKVITINESDFDSAKHTKDLSKCNAQPVSSTTTELTKTGPGDIAALFAVVAIAGAAAYNWVLRRQS